MKIVLLDKSTLGKDIDLSSIKNLGELISYDTTLNEKDTISKIDDAPIVITNKVLITRRIMEQTKIKLICISATGMNNVDLEAAKDLGIIVKNVTNYSTSSVAQVTISYALKFIQDLDYYNEYTKTKKWIDSKIFTNLDSPFSELNGKKWGIIGLGNIGLKVATIASAFGCEINYYSTSRTNHNSTYKQLELDELLKQSDIISIHCPLNESTKNLLNKSNLNMIKDEAILINVARGGIINEKDLVEVFNKLKFKCALDTIESEPMKNNSPLIELLGNKRLILTPHIAWASVESRKLLIQKLAKNIKDFLI